MNRIHSAARSFLIIYTVLATTVLKAQTFNKIKEINTTATVGSIATFSSCAVGNTIFFAANDGNIGSELWKTEGTAASTMLVKDIRAGINGSVINNMVEANGLLYFTADDGVNGGELWRSDGTNGGTYMLKDIRSGSAGSGIVQIYNHTEVLYFSANNGTNGLELWKTDGTEAGTVMVKDIFTGPSNSMFGTASSNAFLSMGADVYFAASSSNGRELWKSDGTDSGTVMVKDIWTGGFSSISNHKAALVNGKLYFAASNGNTINGTELWATDGTDAGTYLVKDIANGSASASPNNLIEFDGTLFFTASSTNNGTPDLWKTDGTNSGTVMVRNFVADGIGLAVGTSNISNQFTVVGNKLFFVNNTGPLGVELYMTDGTAGGTGIVKDILPGQNGSTPTSLISWNGKVYFSVFVQSFVSERKLFYSDGTTVGTSFVTYDELSPILSVSTGNFASTENQLFFGGITIDQGNEVWKTDGTSAGTNLISDINTVVTGTPNSGASLFGSTTMNGYYYFAAANSTQGLEIWKSNGTEAGTVIVKDIWPGKGSSNPLNFFTAGGFVYFSATDNFNGTELWKTDGTETGTVMVKDIWTGLSSSAPRQFTVSNNLVYFHAEDPINGRELWKTDGTAAGTSLVQELVAGIGSGLPNANDFISAGNYAYYAFGKLYKVDGTTNTITELSSSIVNVNDLGVNNDTLYIIGRNTLSQTVLWKSFNGAAPVQVKILSNSTLSGYQLTACNGKMFFNANNGTSGQEPWVSDGTEVGTYMIKDINPGAGSSQPFQFVASHGKVYFQASNAANNFELWATDGTEAGTYLVKDIFPGSTNNGFPSAMIAKPGGNILFVATDGVSGVELWESDGTTSGTNLKQDFNTSGDGFTIPGRFLNYSQDFLLTKLNNGNDLLFFARSADKGIQLYTGSIAGTYLYVNDTSRLNDAFTTAVGSNANNGSQSAPFVTLTYALSQASEGDTIYVDAGIYAEQVIINKGITIIGAGQNFTSFIPPATTLVPAPGPFTEIGLFETTQGIGDVHISNLYINSINTSQNIIIQSGGSVKNCTLLNGGQGIFFRVESAVKTALIENNYIQPQGIGINCQGSSMTAIIINNTITNPAGFFAGIFAGLDFGPLPQLTIQNNLLTNTGFSGIGMEVNSYNGNYNLNSIVGFPLAIRTYNTGNTPNATCNWYGTTTAGTIAGMINGSINYIPYITNSTDNSSNNGFQPVNAACSGRNIYYVNDNSLTGDVFTSAIGSNSNNGSQSAPFASISYALTQAAPDDYIYVDAGTFTEQVTTDKGISIFGAGQNLTSILKPAVTVAPPGLFTEQGVIQTAQSITGDVHISNLSVTGDHTVGVTSVIFQTGGSVKNCKLQNGNQGIFVRIDSTINNANKTIFVDANTIHAEYIAVNFAGLKLTATLTNNTLATFNPGFSTGVFAGLDFGTLNGLTVTGNTFSSFVSDGLLVRTNNGTISQNSFLGTGPKAINKIGGSNINATCNWFGSADVNVLASKITPGVTFSPWLVNGTDNSSAIGFQPLPNVCTGRQTRFYVNNNTSATKIFTTAAGNDANPGIPSAPFATISAAYQKAQTGDSLFIDAGTYSPGDGTIGKSITLVGTNYLTSPNDVTNPLNANSSRVAETIISNLTWTIGANDIRVKGFTFDPQSKTALVQTNNSLDFDNVEISKNIFLAKSTITVVNLTGKQQSPLVTKNYVINDNRFIKQSGGGSTSISINAIDTVQINNNVFNTDNTSANNARIQNSIVVNGLTGDIVISNNQAYQQNIFINGISAKKTTISLNTADECNRLFFASSSNVNPNEVEITDNVITNPRSTGGPVISYVRSNGTNLSSPNIARIERNTITLNGTGLTFVAQALIAPTIDAASANTQVYIRDNKLSITGDFSTQSGANNYVSAIRFLNNSRQVVVERNEMQFTATNYGSANKFGIGFLHNGLQPGTSFNFQNNKFSGFPTSVGIQNNGNANNYGELPNGVTVNINNNSFTGDVMSINNGTVSQTVQANCNWFGSAAAQNFISKLTLPTVDIVPWLTNGTDNDVATGFQPVAGACDGYPTLITLNDTTNVTCNGAANGTINITTSYGKAPFTYTWTKDGDANFVSHNEDLTGLAPGTYRLAITDGNGSNIYITDPNADGPGTIVVTITEPDVLTASASGDNNICFNGTIGSAAVVAEGGTAPYTYLWSNGATTDEITNLIAGTYSVTVTDANGCTTVASYVVTQPTQVTLSITNGSTACSNIATVIVSGGTPGYTYLWSNGSTSVTISGVPVGTYSVTVTDANGCTATTSVTLSVGEAFNPSASVTNITCFGANNGIITVTNANGTAPFMFSKDGGVNFVSGSLPFSFTNLAPGTYNIAVKDAGGCTGFVEKIVTQPTQLTTTHTVQNTCAGATTGSISVTVNGGSPSYSYSWSGPNSFTSTQLNISNLAAGNYTLTVTDKNNCTVVVPVTVNPFPAIVIARTITDVACRGGATGAINITATGGTGSGFTYSWTGGIISSAEDLNNIGKGTYKIRVTDNGSGCIVDSTFIVNEPASSLALATVKTNATGCNSLGTITGTGSGGTAPYTYNINGGAYVSSGLFTGLYAGSYTIGIMDARGCTTTKVVAITDNGGDEYEGTGPNKNNTKTRAFTIPIATNIYARIPTVADSLDWYKFTTASIGNYTVTFSHPNPAIVFDVYTSTGTIPMAPATGSTPTAKTYSFAAGTQYFIKVYGALSFICYDLKVSFGGAARINNNHAPANETGNGMKPVITAEVIKATAFPNPHQGTFALSIESPEQGIAMIELFTANGQQISERKVNVLKGKGNLVQYNNMHQTVLYYRIRIGKHMVTGKIIGPN
ncbi:MAG: hypothetical protein K2Q24_05325 [Chitinophagaceae bacterium]|jgi:ELWxxDGT repeat protein|nr:hypothetical protein [Chitinophagaceae bacterium]